MMARNNSIRLRPYCDKDWTAICDLHNRARLDELTRTVGAEAFRSLEETYKDEGLFDDKLVVAELEGIVVGFIAFDANEVTWLYVEPGHYRRGIGRMLLRKAIDEGGGCIRVELLDGNASALELYRSEGFRVVDHRDGHLVGNETFEARGLVLERRG